MNESWLCTLNKSKPYVPNCSLCVTMCILSYHRNDIKVMAEFLPRSADCGDAVVTSVHCPTAPWQFRTPAAYTHGNKDGGDRCSAAGSPKI